MEKTYNNHKIELLPVYTNLVRREAMKSAIKANQGDQSAIVDGAYDIVAYCIKSFDGITDHAEIIKQLLDMGMDESRELFLDVCEILKADENIESFVRAFVLGDEKKTALEGYAYPQ